MVGGGKLLGMGSGEVHGRDRIRSRCRSLRRCRLEVSARLLNSVATHFLSLPPPPYLPQTPTSCLKLARVGQYLAELSTDNPCTERPR